MVMAEQDKEKIISAREAARMLGVSPRTVIKLVESGQLVGYRVSFVWRFKRGDVEAYLERHRHGGQADEDE